MSKGEYRKLFKCLLVCVYVCTPHREKNMWERREERRLFRIEVVAHWQTALPCSASSLLSFLTSFDIFNYVFHTWLGTCFFFFFFLSTLSWSPSSAILSLALLPILFQRLRSISFLSGRSLLALCGGPFHTWGSGSPGILLLPGSVADGARRGQWGRVRDRPAKEWKGCCQICQGLPFNLSGDPEGGPHRARFREWRQTCVFGWLHPSYGSSSWQ